MESNSVKTIHNYNSFFFHRFQLSSCYGWNVFFYTPSQAFIKEIAVKCFLNTTTNVISSNGKFLLYILSLYTTCVQVIIFIYEFMSFFQFSIFFLCNKGTFKYHMTLPGVVTRIVKVPSYGRRYWPNRHITFTIWLKKLNLQFLLSSYGGRGSKVAQKKRHMIFERSLIILPVIEKIKPIK